MNEGTETRPASCRRGKRRAQDSPWKLALALLLYQQSTTKEQVIRVEPQVLHLQRGTDAGIASALTSCENQRQGYT